MEVTVEQSGTCEATVALTVPWDEFRRQFERTLRQQGQRVRLKGFRAGKVPLAILEKQLGDQVRHESIEHFLGAALHRAVEEHKLEPATQHDVEVGDVEVEEGKHVKSTLAISLRPEIELGDYKDVEVESELEPVGDRDVEAAVADLRRQRSRPEPVGEEGLPKDGMALCSVRWEKDGQVLLEREGLRFSPEVPPANLDPGEFESALVGAVPGDVREIALVLPDDFEPEELRGQPATCRIEVTEAYRIVPPTDEEVQSMLEVEDWQGVLDLARQRIGEARERGEEARIETVLIERLIQEHQFELPERMVERQVRSREQQLQSQLEEQGAEPARIEQELEAQRPDLRRQTERGIKAYFLIRAIAEKEGLKVTEHDLTDELKRIAQRNQATFAEVRDYYRENRLLEQVGLELLERKVRHFLREQARITQPT